MNIKTHGSKSTPSEQKHLDDKNSFMFIAYIPTSKKVILTPLLLLLLLLLLPHYKVDPVCVSDVCALTLDT